MANYGKLFSRIWVDPEFTALDAAAQQLYCLLISHSTRDHAGVLPMALRRWARCTSGATIETIRGALARLINAGFTVVDWDTEEVLVRTFIRNDEVYKQPQVMRSALKSAVTVESPALRWALHDELMKLENAIDKPDLRTETDKAINALVDGLPAPCAHPARTLPEPCAEAPGVGAYVSTVGEAPTPAPTTAPAPDDDTPARGHEREPGGIEPLSSTEVVVPEHIDNGSRPAKRRPSSSAKWLVRNTIGGEYPNTTIDQLAVQVDKLLAEDKPETRIRETLLAWQSRPDKPRPAWLGSVYGDLVQQSHASPPRSTSDERAAAVQALKTPEPTRMELE